MLARCCGPSDTWSESKIQVNQVTARVLPAREDITFLGVSDRDSELFRKLDTERLKIGMTVCYASVFDEHWITTLGQANARSVKSCGQLEGPAYQARRILER